VRPPTYNGYDYRYLRLALKRRIIPRIARVITSLRAAWDATGEWSNGRFPGATVSGA
jgi:hypothetical protein